MTNSTPTQITVSLRGDERTLAVRALGDDRLLTTGSDFYGVFPTGSKQHLMQGVFHRCVERDGKAYLVLANGSERFTGFNVTVGRDEQGQPWLLDSVLYSHNRNVGRLVNWSDKVSPDHVAKW
jgi:hypothetical protein